MRCELVAGHADFVPLADIAGVLVELRYASAQNFAGRDLYGDLNCAYLHRHAAQALRTSAQWLQQHAPQRRLLVLDALRPHRVQITLWNFLGDTPLRQYLANPARGSIHSFGMAVDVTLVDAQGHELHMGTGFDDLTELSHPSKEREYLAQGRLTQEQIANRQLLRDAMQAGGFAGISSEWWHFDYGDRVVVRESYTRIE
jgi:D-alanyl-D-alanine dipeptidase